MAPRDIAEKLYELNEDMDSRDYKETKEEDIKNIAKALGYISDYIEHNCNPVCFGRIV